MKKLLLFIGLGLFYLGGAITVHYHLFPFPQIIELKKIISDNEKPNYIKNRKYTEQVDFYKIFETKKANIVMLGDSITYRMYWNELFNKPIINRGIGSDTTEGFIHRMDSIYKLKPKKVFVMGGINDIGKEYEVNQIFSNYQKILQGLKDNNITPYVQSTLLTSRKDINPKVIELNTLLKKYCEDNNIHFIDLNKELSKDNLIIEKYTTDGVHLNAKGYQVWKSKIKNYLQD